MFSQDFLCDVVDFMRGARWEAKHKSADPCIKTQHELRVIRKMIVQIIPLLSLLGLDNLLTNIRRILTRQVTSLTDMSDDFMLDVCSDIGKRIISFQVPSDLERYLIGCDFDILFKKIVHLPADETTLRRIIPLVSFYHSILIWKAIRQIPDYFIYTKYRNRMSPYKTHALRRHFDEAITMFSEMHNASRLFKMDIIKTARASLDVRILVAKKCDISGNRCLEIIKNKEWINNREFIKEMLPQLAKLADVRAIMKNPYDQIDYSPLCHLIKYNKDPAIEEFSYWWKYEICEMFLKIAKFKHFVTLPTNQQYLIKRVAYELIIKDKFEFYEHKTAIRAWLNIDESNKPISLKKTMAYQEFTNMKISKNPVLKLPEDHLK